MPTELLEQLAKGLGPFLSFLAFLAVLVFGYLYRRDGRNGRQTTRDDIKVIRATVERQENRMDRHLEQHSPAD